jgi:hypothetical protein
MRDFDTSFGKALRLRRHAKAMLLATRQFLASCCLWILLALAPLQSYARERALAGKHILGLAEGTVDENMQHLLPLATKQQGASVLQFRPAGSPMQ